MKEDAAVQLRRLLALLPAITDDQEHTLDDVARRTGADARTVVRDLESLANRLDDPAGFVESVQLYIERDRVSAVSSHFRRPMGLTVAELRALELGLTMIEAERPPDDREPIRTARERLRKAIAAMPAQEVEDDPRHAIIEPPKDAAVLATVRTALRDRRKLRIDYRHADASESSNRTVRPYRLLVGAGFWYLLAFCERSGGLRVFRVDRIEKAEVLEERFEEPAELDLNTVVGAGGVFLNNGAAMMTVRYSPRIARWIAERAGRTVDGDGSLTMDHPLGDVEWAVRHVLQYGPDAEVLEPESVRVTVRDRLRAVIEAVPSGT